MSGVSRPALALLLILTLASCAPDGAVGSQEVEVVGKITAFTASGDGLGYLIDVPDHGLLPLDLGEQRPSLRATGVIVEVPDSVHVPDDLAGKFEALKGYVEDTGESLPVLRFLP